MLNGVKKNIRTERTIDGVLNQIDDFRFIIIEYIEKMSEREMRDFYELNEDIDRL